MKRNYVSPKSEYIDFAAEERIMTAELDINTFANQDGSSPDVDTGSSNIGSTDPFAGNN